VSSGAGPSFIAAACVAAWGRGYQLCARCEAVHTLPSLNAASWPLGESDERSGCSQAPCQGEAKDTMIWLDILLVLALLLLVVGLTS
jgi:hypothetical protein